MFITFLLYVYFNLNLHFTLNQMYQRLRLDLGESSETIIFGSNESLNLKTHALMGFGNLAHICDILTCVPGIWTSFWTNVCINDLDKLLI